MKFKEQESMTEAIEAAPDLFDEVSSISLTWSENPAAKRLLDVIASILAEEYIQTARQNPEIFTI